MITARTTTDAPAGTPATAVTRAAVDAGAGDARLPVVLLTGFLGSGKTTLLNRLLRDPALSDSVVVVNEFGEVPLDHLLIRHVDEHIRLLDTGCLCCAVRGDLVDTLADLAARRERGEIAFGRIFVETSGLVDPTPIFHSLAVDPTLVGTWRLQAVVTTLDAVNGAATLHRHEEARRQVALADALVVTKGDLADVEPGLAAARAINPAARAVRGDDPRLGELLASARVLATDDPEHPAAGGGHRHQDGHHHDASARHTGTIVSRSIVLDDPVPLDALAEWVDLLAALRGDRLLRLKGIVRTRDDPERPRLVQAVQHVVHPIEVLDGWPGTDRRTRLVVIGDGLDLDTVERTFRRYAVPA